MTPPSPDRPRDADDVDELGHLPVDPDIDLAEDARHRPDVPSQGPFRRAARVRWPRIHWRVVVAVAIGAFFGGLARYAVGLAWPTSAGAFPWDTFGVNTVGAFILALTLVLVLEVLPPSTYLRPMVGTGFCGALTTFSSVATGVDHLAAHGHTTLAVGFVAVSLIAGLAAASFGLIVGRSIAANQERGHD